MQNVTKRDMGGWGGGVKMANFSVTYLLNGPQPPLFCFTNPLRIYYEVNKHPKYFILIE